jgi:Domain of unknown function (DUF4864)
MPQKSKQARSTTSENLHRAIIVRMVAALAFTFLVAFCASAFAQDAVPDADTKATQQVIGEQIEAFKAGDGAKAYSYAAPSIKQVFTTVDIFMNMVQSGYMPLYKPESYVFGSNTIISGQVHQEVLVTDAQGKQWQAVYTLMRQEDGSWKVTGVKLNPYNGVSA